MIPDAIFILSAYYRIQTIYICLKQIPVFSKKSKMKIIDEWRVH